MNNHHFLIKDTKEQPDEEIRRAARSGWGAGWEGRVAGAEVSVLVESGRATLLGHQHVHQLGSPSASLFQVSSGVSSRRRA